MQTPTRAKFEISIFEKLDSTKLRNRNNNTWKNVKSAPQNLKFDFDFGFLGQKFDLSFWKFQNRFLPFLSNFILRPHNLKSPTSKIPKLFFSRQNSNFSSIKILILY